MNEVNFRTLDLNLLRVFDEVMVERNLTRAAHNLAMTQPAVSNALRRLREALGDDLVVRRGYGVEPTRVALNLWPSVRTALHQLRESLAPGGFDPARAAHTFALALADVSAAMLLPRLVETLGHEAPGVTLNTQALTTRDPRGMLESGQADLAIGYFPGVLAELGATHLQETAPRFRHLRLYDGEYVVVMRRTHPLARGTLTLDAYCAARHVLVNFSGRSIGFVDEALAHVGRRRRIVLTVNQFFTALSVITQTSLLAVLPRHFVASDPVLARSVAVQPLPLPMPPIHVDMLWSRRMDADPAQRWLREQIALASPAPSGAQAPKGVIPEA